MNQTDFHLTCYQWSDLSRLRKFSYPRLITKIALALALALDLDLPAFNQFESDRASGAAGTEDGGQMKEDR